MPVQLTPGRASLMRFILRTIEEKHLAPSIREAEAAMKVTGNSIRNRIEGLRRLGFLEAREARIRRGLIPTRKAWDLRPAGRALSDWRPVEAKLECANSPRRIQP